MSDQQAAAYDVRPARARDLRHLAAVEEAGLPLFEEHLGDLSGTVLAAAPASGGHRADQPGHLLVAADAEGRVVGFAHVLLLDAPGGTAHLEQLSVHPDAMRRGLGSRLVRAAMDEARRDGFRALSLCTYRDLPFNGPFYAALGFAEVSDLEPFQRDLRAHERALGLDAYGVRVVMSAPLR